MDSMNLIKNEKIQNVQMELKKRKPVVTAGQETTTHNTTPNSSSSSCSGQSSQSSPSQQQQQQQQHRSAEEEQGAPTLTGLWAVNAFLLLGWALVAVEALLLGAEGAVRLFTGTAGGYRRPSYADHEHHLCHTLVALFALLVVWYFLSLVMLVLNREVMSHQWGSKFLGIPNALVTLSQLATFLYIGLNAYSHEERVFAGVLSCGCCAVLLGLVYIGTHLVLHPLRTGRRYVWPHLVLGLLGFLLNFVCCYVNNLNTPALCGGAATIAFAYGVYGARQQLNLLYA
eukprot:TRINITY_DN4053_c0_g1_i1.p1 TRINITY_DN4053_c0_g1~~TRINITY_DN4053_c0_g1_i1.p1  ORF type:complete len:285 (+),score=59.10 TRINITY_DN4053_c0_g1_i1:81-935(+)